MNITTDRQDHNRHCRYTKADETWGDPGDIRLCRHGRTQVGVEVLGLTHCAWLDVTILRPIEWWRARRVLRKAGVA